MGLPWPNFWRTSGGSCYGSISDGAQARWTKPTNSLPCGRISHACVRCSRNGIVREGIKAMAEETRRLRKSLVGLVTSRTGDRSVKVTYFYKEPHPRYLREVRRKTVVHVHDADNRCSVGDRVEIMETRPLSRLKRWRVRTVLQKVSTV
jgi:small subunit ribosomal protein S17